MKIPNLVTGVTARLPGDWKHLSLFSGSGIGTLAARAAGIVTVAHAENDPACCYCLERLWPDARLFRDVRDVTAESLADLGTIDIISGGFPCQDVSTASKGEGLGTEENPTRSGLWFEFARIIREVRPRFLLVENVPALRSRGADKVLNDMEALDYSAWAFVVGADEVGAPQIRRRVWILGHSRSLSVDGRSQDAWWESVERIITRWPSPRGGRAAEWERPRIFEREMVNATDGLSRRVRRRANKALSRMVGNAWCYENAVLMFRAIRELGRELTCESRT